MSATLRCKVRVNSVVKTFDQPENGKQISETISANAVYSDDPNSENKQWSEWTPEFNLNMKIDNPNAFGKVREGYEFYVDFIPVEKQETAKA